MDILKAFSLVDSEIQINIKGSNSCFDYLQIFTNDIFIYYL